MGKKLCISELFYGGGFIEFADGRREELIGGERQYNIYRKLSVIFLFTEEATYAYRLHGVLPAKCILDPADPKGCECSFYRVRDIPDTAGRTVLIPARDIKFYKILQEGIEWR